MGRDLYPEEVNDIRRSVWETQIEDARQMVAGRDLQAAGIPGLKVHASDIDDVRKIAAEWMTANGVEGVEPSNVAYEYTKMDKLTKQKMLHEIPEFEDVLAVPPWQEAGQAKAIRKARKTYFDAKEAMFATYSREQRAADEALTTGSIDAKEWRDIHESISKKRAGGIQALDQDPNFKPFLDTERQTPSAPEELAYDQLAKLTPTDVNENGVIDEEDMSVYYEVRDSHIAAQPGWIQDYIQERKAINDTPVEQQYAQAGRVLNQYFAIPKWVGFSQQESLVATRVLERAREFARLAPGPTQMSRLIMTMPGLAPEERTIGLRALTAQDNPARFAFWVGHEELEYFYGDFRPAQPEPRRAARSRRRRR